MDKEEYDRLSESFDRKGWFPIRVFRKTAGEFIKMVSWKTHRIRFGDSESICVCGERGVCG